jgi:hypothetical protein
MVGVLVGINPMVHQVGIPWSFPKNCLDPWSPTLLQNSVSLLISLVVSISVPSFFCFLHFMCYIDLVL